MAGHTMVAGCADTWVRGCAAVQPEGATSPPQYHRRYERRRNDVMPHLGGPPGDGGDDVARRAKRLRTVYGAVRDGRTDDQVRLRYTGWGHRHSARR